MNLFLTHIDYDGIWHKTLFFGLAFSVLALAWRARRFVHWSALLALAYPLIWALYIIEYPTLPFEALSHLHAATAGQTALELLLIPALAVCFPVHRVLPGIVLYTLACVWASWEGLMVAPSFNTALAASAIPFIPWWMAPAVIVTAFTHHGSTALMVLGAQALPFVFKHRFARLAAIPGGALCLLSAWLNSGTLFDSSTRLSVWRTMLEFWAADPWRVVLGYGPGSFAWKSLELRPDRLFFAMHSDLLQVLFELGIVGLGLVLGAVGVALVRGSNRERSALLGLLAFSLTYHPLRFFPTACIAALAMWQALKRPNETA